MLEYIHLHQIDRGKALKIILGLKDVITLSNSEFGSVILCSVTISLKFFATCLPVSRLIILSFDIPPEIIESFFLNYPIF